MHTGSPKGRIGVMTPPALLLDKEYWTWAPQGFSVFFTRMDYIEGPMTPARARAESEPEKVRRASAQLSALDPDAVLFACTIASFVGGVAGEAALRRVIEDSTGGIAVTTSGALLHALDALGVSTVAVATPYSGELTHLLAEYLSEAGYEVVSNSFIGMEDAKAVADVNDDAVIELAKRADSDSAEALFLSCTNLPTGGVIGRLEQALGKPVCSANQVGMWSMLEQLGMAARVNGAMDQALFRTSFSDAAE